MKNVETQTMTNDETEIDLVEIFHLLLSKIVVIVLVAVLFAGAAGIGTKLFIAPKYESSSMIYILSKSTSITSMADIQIGTSLTKDYAVLVKSRPVVETVIDNLKLDMGYKALSSRIKINNPADTRILTITIDDENAETAKKIVDEFANVAAKQMSTIMKTDEPSIVEKGTTETTPVSPSTKKNAAIAGLLGALLVCGIVIIRFLMDDTIRSSEDVEKYLGLTTLGAIPEGKRKDKKGGEA